jgi:hypothetical protein
MALARSGGKGFDLEEALRAYFWRAGYFVLRDVPFRLDDDEVTDIDLWLYERPAALTRRRLIVDAKNRRSPKVSERLIWAKGLQAALGVDGAIVATTDKRPSAKKLSKLLNVTLLDGDAVAKLVHSQQLKKMGQVRSEELDVAVKRIDDGRRSAEWRQTLQEARASVVVGMGAQSINKGLSASAFFAGQMVSAHPQSDQAEVGLRLFYHTSALAAISLDYLLADDPFRSQDKRRQSIIGSIRFGSPEAEAGIPLIRAAIGLARKYGENGATVAKQIEYGFFGEADRIPADVIADYVSRVSSSDALFNVAREIEIASTSVELRSYDDLSPEAKSLLGVFLDFNGISREKIAAAWPRRSELSRKDPTRETRSDAGPLFEETEQDIRRSDEACTETRKRSR